MTQEFAEARFVASASCPIVEELILCNAAGEVSLCVRDVAWVHPRFQWDTWYYESEVA